MMNTMQRIIISIGVLLVVGSGLFPPYEGELSSTNGGVVSKYMGYHFLFKPPTESDISIAITGRPSQNSSFLRSCNFHIIATRIWIQIAVVSIATVGLFFLFSGRRHETEINE
jgi:hypothetical protein